MADDLRRTPQQERSRRSLDAILDATAELLAETDPATITMSAIGSRAGVSKAAIYRYYPDRPAVIRALAQRYLDPMVERLVDGLPTDDSLDGDATDRLVDNFVALFTDEPVVHAIWISGFSYPEVGPFCADFDRQLADRLVSTVCSTATEEGRTRAQVMIRALRATVELGADLEPDRRTALVEQTKVLFRSGALA